MLCLVLKKITDVDIRRGTEVGKGCGTHIVLVAETAGFTMSGISIDNSSNYAVLGYELVRPGANLRRKCFPVFPLTIDVCKRKGRGRSAARQDITAETPVNFGTNEHPYKAAKILIIY